MATAKRKLKAIDFSSDNSHIALVGKAIGGPANGADYQLALKSKFSSEVIEKASQVTLTLSIDEFLQRFFHLYGVEADLLARALGFTTEAQEKAALEMQEDMLEDQEPAEYPSWDDEPGSKKYEKYIESKLQSFSIMKSLSGGDLVKTLAGLDEKEYLNLLLDQQLVEKAFEQIDKSSESVNSEDETSTIASVENKVEAQASVSKLTKGKSMPKANEAKAGEPSVELVEKAKFDALEIASVELQKSLDIQKVELQKAMETIAAFEAEKKQAIVKSKQEAVSAIVKDEKQAAVIIKAALLIEDQADFEGFVSVIKQMQEQVEKSALFQEQGATVESTEQIQESAVARILKAQFTK